MFFKSKDSKSQVNEQAVLGALSQVQDPDLKRDIVSLGFVKNMKIKGGSVSFDVELTTPACPVKDELKAQSEKLVKALPGVEAVEIKMTSNVRPTAPQANRISLPKVRNVIAVASGKGGVGKSTVAVNIAAALVKTGARVGLLDADIYGPSIPLMLGVKQRPESVNNKLVPLERHGIRLMSIGFLVPDDQAVVWRGPMVHGALTQFMTQVEWGDLDYLLVDMPPGTGDAQLTMSQNAPLSGAIIVTTPQEVSILDARRGGMMFKNVNVPILGIVENMAGFALPGSAIVNIFGSGGGQKIADEMKVPLLGSIPIDPRMTESGDKGTPFVVGYPDAEGAKTIRKIAGDMAARLSTLQAETSGNFQPVSMQWQ